MRPSRPLPSTPRALATLATMAAPAGAEPTLAASCRIAGWSAGPAGLTLRGDRHHPPPPRPDESMMRRLLAPLLIVLAAPPAAAQALPAGLPSSVASIVITGQGLRGDDVTGEETAADCARFRLRRRDVWAFLARARPVDSAAYYGSLEMSRCRVEGSLRLADGRRGRWRIDAERRGIVLLPGAPPVFLHCPRCAAAAFEPPYDPDRDG